MLSDALEWVGEWTAVAVSLAVVGAAEYPVGAPAEADAELSLVMAGEDELPPVGTGTITTTVEDEDSVELETFELATELVLTGAEELRLELEASVDGAEE